MNTDKVVLTSAVRHVQLIAEHSYETARALYDRLYRERPGDRFLFDLRCEGTGKLWYEIAYLPRVDHDEVTPLRPGYTIKDFYGVTPCVR